ncbi:hypothetical protein F0L68_28225 [Solihabitans fulvus]|uniref:Uncharacterized protein n=1 Tax=Solihabitans fulvus TaxID=1892852 RepID=A0A5B2WY71_9PSEU|nr:hypothetical protein [Solihabitans fulvus]KAA2255456.1 hypothetical protein F0L68_28225 [Solihabitans fulvus]
MGTRSMVTEGVAEQARRLRQVTAALAWQPDAQLSYLRNLGPAALVDELAFRFEDAYLALPDLRRHGLVSDDATWLLVAIDTQFEAMSNGRISLWSEKSLVASAEWQRIRHLARQAVTLLARQCADTED